MADFQNFAQILAMDTNNLADMKRICPSEHLFILRLLMEFAANISETEVPDPYYVNEQGIDRVLELCEEGARG